ncbi:hypothetical protein BV25DRAFT_1800598 [Artomyces pyxidatus]|uniref:Uncharacterized protein n=1 Tax=Artomyces pyxidatus TaxID=48021 RepID=A0ACB8T6J6_9AGAM|nr:hypothetical protein BV25DRAFT_1800598 [Artomyces pyxidatus]
MARRDPPAHLPFYASSSTSSSSLHTPRLRTSSRSPMASDASREFIWTASPLTPSEHDDAYPLYERDDSYPPRRRPRWFSPTSTTLSRFTPPTLLTLIKFGIPTALLILIYLRHTRDPRGELTFYDRPWVQPKILPPPRLAGCFSSERVSSLYNVSERVYGARYTEIQSGSPMRLGLDCYDFAGTIHASPDQPRDTRTNFHTFWRADRGEFDARHEWMLKSFFATQPLARSRLIVWSNRDLSYDATLRRYVGRYPDALDLRFADVRRLAEGTPLQGSARLRGRDARQDEDLVRMLVVWNEGGVWVDMDSLLTRDLTPLLEHEFVTQWECYDRKTATAKGALMHFHQHSPYLCEAFHIIADAESRIALGGPLYRMLWQRLVAGGIPPFKILPFCFSDARSCNLDNRIPDPFAKGSNTWTDGITTEKGGGLDTRLQEVFGLLLHNQRAKDFPAGGWIRRLLLDRYEQRLRAMETEL